MKLKQLVVKTEPYNNLNRYFLHEQHAKNWNDLECALQKHHLILCIV